MTPQTGGNTAEIISIGETDSLAPYEFYSTFKRSYYTDPERGLMAAVLENAVTCLTFNQPSYSRRQQKDFAEALASINDREDDWIFAFVNICETPGLEPGCLRNGLNAQSAQLSKLATRRYPSRRGPGLRHKQFRLRTVN